MRAHIVFAALQTQNRFALCHLAFKSIRKLHKPSTRIQDTTNDALQRLAGAERQRVSANAGDENKLVVLEVKRKPGAIETQTGAGPQSLASAINPPDATPIIPAELTRKAS